MTNNRELPTLEVLSKNVDFCLYSCFILILDFLIFANIYIKSLSEEFVLICVILLAYALYILKRTVRISNVLFVETKILTENKTSISNNNLIGNIFKAMCLISITEMLKIIAVEVIIFWSLFIYLVTTKQWNDTVFMGLIVIPQVSLPILVTTFDLKKDTKKST